jgi:hypothetical protein
MNLFVSAKAWIYSLFAKTSLPKTSLPKEVLDEIIECRIIYDTCLDLGNTTLYTYYATEKQGSAHDVHISEVLLYGKDNDKVMRTYHALEKHECDEEDIISDNLFFEGKHVGKYFVPNKEMFCQVLTRLYLYKDTHPEIYNFCKIYLKAKLEELIINVHAKRYKKIINSKNPEKYIFIKKWAIYEDSVKEMLK